MVRTVQTQLLSQLACNDASFGLNLRQKRSRQHDKKCRLKSSQAKSVYFNHPSQGNSTNYYLTLGLRDKAATPPTSQQINKFPLATVCVFVWTELSMHYVGYHISVHSVLCQCRSTCTLKPFENSEPTGLKVDIAVWCVCV